MKTIICKKVEYVPVVYVQSIINNTVTLIANKAFSTLTTEKAEYTVESNSADAGTSYAHNINVSFVDDGAAKKTFKNYRGMVFRLTGNDGSVYIVGRQKYPVRLQQVTEDTNEIRASFLAKLPQFVELQ